MCGVYCSINTKKPNLKKLKQVLDHRGPDSCYEYLHNNVYFFHSRLAIQDLTSGADQPFHHGNLSIIYNGEIYNHLELRKLTQTFKYSTNSDTETLIALYQKYDENMFELLDGMFAFIIFDKIKNRIFIARDRAGKKPLYMYKKNEKLVFSSELNAIIQNVKGIEINEDAINAYLRCGFFFKGYSAYKNVSEVEPGCYYKIDLSTLRIKKTKYFDLMDIYNKPKIKSFDKCIEEVEQGLKKSIQSRLLSSDLEVGAFLSGGIDSSLIVGIASNYVTKLKTFTVKFDGTYDESRLARMTASKYNTDHHEVQIEMNLKNDIENILLKYGQPFMDSSAIPSYYVSREAKKYVTVILNGDGADELFGGYRRYLPALYRNFKTIRYLSFIQNLLPKSNSKSSKYNYFKRLLSMSNKNGLDYYLSSTTDIFEDHIFFNKSKVIQQMKSFIDEVLKSNLSFFEKMLYLDFNLILSSDLLPKMDIATMTNSLEGRSPFLSKYLLETAPRIPDNYKIRLWHTKYVLRKLAEKYIPNKLINQPKRGFEVPLTRWINIDLKENIYDSLTSTSYSSNFISKEFINSVLSKEINVSENKRAKMLWAMYCLEVWKKNFDYIQDQ